MHGDARAPEASDEPVDPVDPVDRQAPKVPADAEAPQASADPEAAQAPAVRGEAEVLAARAETRVPEAPVAPSDAGAAVTPDPRAEIVPPPDPSNYAVGSGDRVTVQAEETLGHYAEWLEVPTSRLRRLNGMTYQTPLVIGRTKKLDFSRVSPEVFEQRRLAYHRDLQEEFFEAFVVTGTTVHTLRRGQSLWYVANECYQVPIWLLRQYNPDLDFGDLHPGTPMVIPTLEPRSS